MTFNSGQQASEQHALNSATDESCHVVFAAERVTAGARPLVTGSSRVAVAAALVLTDEPGTLTQT